MYGGPSQMDLFDYKPELQKRHGQTVEMRNSPRDCPAAKLLASKRNSRGTANPANGAPTRFRASPSTWTSWR